MSNFFVDVRQDLVYAYGWPSWVKRAPKRAYASFRRFSCAIEHHFLGDPDFDVKNAKFFRGRPSRPCLCIRLVITASHHFLVIRIPTSKMPNFFVDVRQDLVYAYGWPSRFVRPIWRVKRAPKRAYASFRRFSYADSDIKNAKFFRGRPSRPCLCIRLAIMACPAHLEGQTSPEASIRLISMIFVCYSIPFFGPCLCIRFAITACPAHLEGQTTPEASICLISMIFIPTSQMPNFFVDVRQDLVFAYGWPSRLVRPIWRVRRAPKRAYASFRRFSCAIAHHFLGDPDSDVKNAKSFRRRQSRPCLCIRLAITACPAHLEGQTSPEASIRLISIIFVCYNTPFFG
uniref:Uncharacterized protein n=1 Tax=Solanum lycopersicum TaxID=4081 RepID=A0A3Q7ILV6_SOLLC